MGRIDNIHRITKRTIKAIPNDEEISGAGCEHCGTTNRPGYYINFDGWKNNMFVCDECLKESK